MEELEESVWSVLRQENEHEDQGEGAQNSGKTSTDGRGRDMGVEEGTGKEIGGRRNNNNNNNITSMALKSSGPELGSATKQNH